MNNSEKFENKIKCSRMGDVYFLSKLRCNAIQNIYMYNMYRYSIDLLPVNQKAHTNKNHPRNLCIYIVIVVSWCSGGAFTFCWWAKSPGSRFRYAEKEMCNKAIQ